MQRSKTGTARTIAVLCAAVLAVAMFGTGVAGAATKSKTTVKVATVPSVGAVLVDRTTGKTLYTLTDANGAAVACTGACLSAWPPATVSATAKVKAPKGVKNLSVTTDTHQVAWKTLPLYMFSGDPGPKTANGEGVNAFGGTWNVVKVTNKASTSVAPTTTSNSGGSTYGGY